MRIRPAIDSGASLFVDGLPRSADTAPAIDWTFPLVRRCGDDRCYTLTGRSSRLEVFLSGVGSGLSALATCDADVW